MSHKAALEIEMADIPSVPTLPHFRNYAYECRLQSPYAILLDMDDTSNTKISPE
jgi:hypothetical protein